MHTGKPVTKVRSDAVLGNRPELRAFLFILGALLLGSCALAAPASKPADKQVKQPAASDFVGSETCATCHEEVSKKFADNPHSKMAMLNGKAGITCENCHGAGKEHVDGGGDTTKIFNPGKGSAKAVDERCLSCHADQHANFDRSAHAKANVSCISCHSIHESEEKAELLKTSQPNLCFTCHADQRPQFSMAFHHKVNEGAVACSDCHDPHGTFGKSNLKSTADQNNVCTKCHMETRGPFVFEHAAVRAEGCTGCHAPHGSQNARLLNVANINALCNQCHSPVAAGTVHAMGAGSASSQPCIDCHNQIHGSNMNWAFLR